MVLKQKIGALALLILTYIRLVIKWSLLTLTEIHAKNQQSKDNKHSMLSLTQNKASLKSYAIWFLRVPLGVKKRSSKGSLAWISSKKHTKSCSGAPWKRRNAMLYRKTTGKPVFQPRRNPPQECSSLDTHVYTLDKLLITGICSFKEERVEVCFLETL